MQLGEVVNAAAMPYGKPLDGVRVLAVEQMQALPFATQLLARLGAGVVKVESPRGGDSGRGSDRGMAAPDGSRIGSTFLRNNLNKRSVCLDLKSERGRELFLELAGRFDVVAENFKTGALARMGLGYDVVAARWPAAIYVSVSGFGNAVPSPYAEWPAYASVAEAMSGLYDFKRQPGRPPTVSPAGALGDISAALFTTIGILAALRHRERTGEGQYVDVAMYDSVLAMTDIVTNWWSLGLTPEPGQKMAVLMDCFRAADGWFLLQVSREHQFERLAETVARPEWVDDPRFATRQGWADHTDDVIRPVVEAWAAHKPKLEVCRELAAAGLAVGPVNSAEDVVADPHVAARSMLVECARPEGAEGSAARDGGAPRPVLVPGSPVKLSKVTEGPETRVPWLGEHTDEVLRAELGLTDDELQSLRDAGITA